MEKFKAFFKWIACNKKSLTSTVIGAAGAGLGITAVWTVETLPIIMLNGVNATPYLYTAVLVICFMLNELGICGKGFESIKTFVERKLREEAEAEAKAIETAAQKQIEAAEAEAKAIEAEAQKQIKADEERKKEAERNAKIERKKAELLANAKK